MLKCGRYILWGSTGHAKVLADLIKLMNGEVVALFDNNPDSHSSLPGVPLFHGIVGFEAWLAREMSPESTCAALAIGGSKGKDRVALAQRLKAAQLTLPILRHPSSIVSDSARLGEGCHILANAVVAADVLIGDFCIINNSANVDHECQLSNGVHIAPGAVLCGCVTVGENSMIGAGAIVLPRVCIGHDVLVGAGAVVTNDVPDGAIVVGNPARRIQSSPK